MCESDVSRTIRNFVGIVQHHDRTQKESYNLKIVIGFVMNRICASSALMLKHIQLCSHRVSDLIMCTLFGIYMI